MRNPIVAVGLLALLLALPAQAEPRRPRARDIGIRIGILPPGPLNAITDVEGVKVGHVTLWEGRGQRVVGKGPIRTGVTAILPHSDDIYANQVYAAAEVLNGNGEMTGTAWVNERGLLEVPIVLTNTLSVGAAYDGVITWVLRQDLSRVPLPVVAECYDGALNDIAGRHVKPNHVVEALEFARSGPVDEGSVGAGTGMRSYGFKAGIGTSSRKLPASDGGYTVGVLVNANMNTRYPLLIDGVAVDRDILDDRPESRDGSIIIVIATDAPLLPTQLHALCRRAGYGVTRTGTVSRTSSGDFAIAFSTAQRITRDDAVTDTVRTVRHRHLTPLYKATAEATEEAIINALTRADTVHGADDRMIPGLPIPEIVATLKAHGRIE